MRRSTSSLLPRNPVRYRKYMQSSLLTGLASVPAARFASESVVLPSQYCTLWSKLLYVMRPMYVALHVGAVVTLVRRRSRRRQV